MNDIIQSRLSGLQLILGWVPVCLEATLVTIHEPAESNSQKRQQQQQQLLLLLLLILLLLILLLLTLLLLLRRRRRRRRILLQLLLLSVVFKQPIGIFRTSLQSGRPILVSRRRILDGCWCRILYRTNTLPTSVKSLKEPGNGRKGQQTSRE